MQKILPRPFAVILHQILKAEAQRACNTSCGGSNKQHLIKWNKLETQSAQSLWNKKPPSESRNNRNTMQHDGKNGNRRRQLNRASAKPNERKYRHTVKVTQKPHHSGGTRKEHEKTAKRGGKVVTIITKNRQAAAAKAHAKAHETSGTVASHTSRPAARWDSNTDK